MNAGQPRSWWQHRASYRAAPRRGSLGRWDRSSLGRWALVALGLAALVAGTAGAAGPYREIRGFRAVVACDRATHDCFAREQVAVGARRTYTTRTTTTDSDGHQGTTTTTHHELTLQRADGSREAREVSWSVYDKAVEGQPAILRLWRGDVVGVEVTGAQQWFQPRAGRQLSYWLYLASVGLGVLLWDCSAGGTGSSCSSSGPSPGGSRPSCW